MTLPNWIPRWTDMTLYHYLAIGGGALLVLALLLYYTPISRLRMPAILLGILGGLIAGDGLGVMTLASFGYHWEKGGDYLMREKMQLEEQKGQFEQERAKMASNGASPRRGGNRGGKAKAPSAQDGGGMANPKAQLASFIAKLDLLTHKSLAVTLTADQKKKMHEQIQKLQEQKELSDDEATVKLAVLANILSKEQLKTLEDAGFRRPDQRNPPPRPNPPSNPFSDGEDSEHVKSLLGQLGDKKAE